MRSSLGLLEAIVKEWVKIHLLTQYDLLGSRSSLPSIMSGWRWAWGVRACVCVCVPEAY